MEFYATVPQKHTMRNMPDLTNWLVSASSAWRGGRLVQPRFNSAHRLRGIAADCGGFVAASRFGGKYPYSPENYVNWLSGFNPSWAAVFDFCCEPPIAGLSSVRDRQQKTTEYAHYFWDTFTGSAWSGLCAWSWIPTIQGWDVEDYQSHALEMKPLIDRMKNQNNFRVGIGTLCVRADVPMIRRVVAAVADVLPDVKFHLWGVKLKALEAGLPASVLSVDSAAWDAGGLKRSSIEAAVARSAAGLTQSQYRFGVCLPSYLAKVDNVSKP